MYMYVNTFVSEAASSHIVAIRYCTLETCFWTRMPALRYSGCCALHAVCRIPTHSCPIPGILFTRLCSCFVVFPRQFTTELEVVRK